MPPPQSAVNTVLPPYSKVSCWMKCGGMSSPLASLTKPESMGCWISACTSVVSPLLVARTRMVDAICPIPCLRVIPSKTGCSRSSRTARVNLTAAAADGNFDFLVGLVELAAGLDEHGNLAGLRHLDAVGDRRHGACRQLV